MAGRRKPAATLAQHAIFGDEDAARLQTEIEDLRATVAELSGRVHAQFTTISAHAEIARQQVDFAREEAHADLERSRGMLIDLIERLRGEIGGGVHLTGSSPGPSHAAIAERLGALESRLENLVGALQQCFDRQRVLADTMEALLDTVTCERRGEPVVGLSLV